MTVLYTVSADELQDGDTFSYDKKGQSRTLTVLTFEDTGDEIRVRAYSHDRGDNVTVTLQPNQRVDILGS